MTGGKYRLEVWGEGVYQIEALVDIPRRGVKAGDLGGFVSGTHNLSQEGDCWVGPSAGAYGMSNVSGDAFVGGEAVIDGSAKVSGEAVVDGSAKVVGDSHVYGKARVGGEAVVKDKAQVHGTAVVGGSVVVGGKTVLDGGESVDEESYQAARKESFSKIVKRDSERREQAKALKPKPSKAYQKAAKAVLSDIEASSGKTARELRKEAEVLPGEGPAGDPRLGESVRRRLRNYVPLFEDFLRSEERANAFAHQKGGSEAVRLSAKQQ